MITIEKLRQYGAKVDEGLARCMNNEKMYLRLVGMAANDKNFRLLEDSFAAGDLDGAFSAAHALKGSLGNLSLEPLFAPVTALTEQLRHKNPGDYDALLATIRERHAALLEMMED